MTVVDPTDENMAILNDGQIGYAFRIAPANAFADPNAPTVAEINHMSNLPIVGYGSFLNLKWED